MKQMNCGIIDEAKSVIHYKKIIVEGTVDFDVIFQLQGLLSFLNRIEKKGIFLCMESSNN